MSTNEQKRLSQEITPKAVFEGRRDLIKNAAAGAFGMALAIPFALASYNATNGQIGLALLMVPTLLNSLYYGPTYSAAQGLVPLRARAIAAAALLFFQNLIGLGLGPLFFGMLSDWLRPEFGENSVRYVLYGAAMLGIIPAILFWMLRPRMKLTDLNWMLAFSMM